MIYIGYVIIDGTVLAKINQKHTVTADEVRSAIQYPAKYEAAWEDHAVHGRRVIAAGTSWSNRAILAWLEPVDETDGTWALRSARCKDPRND